jgi:hypothetical protein
MNWTPELDKRLIQAWPVICSKPSPDRPEICRRVFGVGHESVRRRAIALGVHHAQFRRGQPKIDETAFAELMASAEVGEL